MTADQSEIRALLDQWASGVREKDLERVLATYANDVVAFDAIGALRFNGLERYRQHWQYCMEQTRGEVLFEMRDVRIEQEGALACAYGVCHCGCRNEAGEMESAWMRFTQLLRQGRDGWRIIHEHWSAPFDPQSGKTCFDLQPDEGGDS